MARSGQDELELYLDEAPAVRAAKAIQKSYDDLAKALAATARTFDQNYATAFNHVEASATHTATRIKHEMDGANTKVKALTQGFKDVALGSFAGGFTASAVASAVQTVVGFAQEAGVAFLEGNRAATFLENTTKRFNLSLVETQAQVAKLRQEYNLTHTDAEKALGSAIRAASIAGSPEKGSALLTGTLNLAEASGLTKDRVPDLVRQIATGQDEVFDALFGVNPSFFYDKFAKSVGRTSASLTDLEKAQIRVNTVIGEGSTFLAEHEKFAASAAGKYEILTAKLEDYKRGVAEWIVDRATEDEFIHGPSFHYGPPGGFEDPEVTENKRRLALVAEADQERERRKNAGIQALRDLQAFSDYVSAAVAARADGPFADIRRATKAEQDRIRAANTDKTTGLLSVVGAQQVAVAGAFGAQDEAKRTLEINKQLDAQLLDLQSKYSGEQNPLLLLAVSGKREMDSLLETVKKLGPEFEHQTTAIVAAAQKLQDLNFAKGLVSSAIDVSNIQARIDSLTPTLTTAFVRGRYRQVTDQITAIDSYKKETDIERARRLITALDYEVLTNPNEPEVARAARQALLAQTANISAEALGADPTTRDRIIKELTDEKTRRQRDRDEAAQLREDERAAREKANKANDATTTFHEGLAASGLTGEQLGTALKNLANMTVGVDLNVKSDREFQAAVADGTALDRVTAG